MHNDIYSRRLELVAGAETNTELQQVISNIISKAEIIKNANTDNYSRITLRYGQLTLDIYFMGNDIGEMILVKRAQFPKKDSELTTLSLASKKFITDIANEKRSSITVRFTTSHPNIHRWAQTIGKEIFHWASFDYISDIQESQYIGVIKPIN